MFSPFASKPSTLRALCLSAAAATLLAGCRLDDRQPTLAVDDDYHTVHPVVLTHAPTTLDVFPIHDGQLDGQSLADIREFAGRYATRATGRLVIQAPSPGGRGTRNAVIAIRRALAADGLHGAIGLGTYPAVDPGLASPIRLSFSALKAEVISRCGEWPDDLAGGPTTDAWKNQNYYNYGCATQATISAQVDDPRDLTGPRAETPADVETRLRAINAVRNGQDPGTDWKVKNTDILQVGQGN